MSLTISPSPFGSLVVSVAETGSTLSVTTVATSPSVLTMALGVPGPAGEAGEPGANGVGVPVGGTTGQVLAKIDGTNYNTEWVDAGAAGDFLPLSGGTMSGAILFDPVGGQNISKGSFDSGRGGYNGISLNCANLYELNWQSGYLKNIYNGGNSPINFESNIVVYGNIPEVGSQECGVISGSISYWDGGSNGTFNLSYAGVSGYEPELIGDGLYELSKNGVNGENGNDVWSLNADDVRGNDWIFGSTGITFASDGSVQTTAALPLAGGTLTGDITFPVDVNGNDSLVGSWGFGTENLDAGQSASIEPNQIAITTSGVGIEITSSAITFPDSTNQNTAWLGYNGTTSQYIRGDGSLYTFPPVGDRYLTSSTSTLTCDSGNGKTMTVGTGLSYSRQQDITVSYSNAIHMHGTVLTYDSVTGIMTFDSNTHSGSGTFSNWEVNVGGVAGAVLPVDGSAGQVLAKINSTNFNTEWISLGSMAQATTTDYLSKAGNLSGLASTTTARTNLGLGTMAVATASDYLAKADNLSGLASASTARTNLGLGTASTLASSAVAQTANNLSDLASASTARTNLGLGTAATQTTATFLQTANNLSDVTASTARTNLGLGAVSTDAYASTAQAQAGTSTTTVINPSTLLDAKYFQGGKYVNAIVWSTAVAGTGASAGAGQMNIRTVQAPTSATGSAVNYGTIQNQVRGQTFGASTDWSKKVVFGGRFVRNTVTPDSNSIFRFGVGRTGTTSADITASDKQVQIKVAGTGAVQLLCANGTNLSTTTSTFTPTNLQCYDVVVISDGAGNVTLYVNGSSVATSTGGPTSTTAGTNYNNFYLEAHNTSTLTNGAMVVYGSDFFLQINS